MRETVRTAVVLEGGDHPALGLDRRELGQADFLQELERLVVRRPRQRPQGLGLLPEPLACLPRSGQVSLDRSAAQLAVFAREFRGWFPGEVGYLAVGRQPPKCRVVHVAAQRQLMVHAGQAGPDASGLVGPAVGQDVAKVISVPGQTQDTGESLPFDKGARHTF